MVSGSTIAFSTNDPVKMETGDEMGSEISTPERRFESVTESVTFTPGRPARTWYSADLNADVAPMSGPDKSWTTAANVLDSPGASESMASMPVSR